MGNFVNPTWVNVTCWGLTAWVIGTNIYTAVTQVVPLLDGIWIVLALVVGGLYVAFLLAVGWKDFSRAARAVLVLLGKEQEGDEEQALLDSLHEEVSSQRAYGAAENGGSGGGK